jgi:hypothetical protein
MKLKVLIPSEEYRNYAGARIRYGRLRAELARNGIALLLEDIGEFAPERDESDALLISKCHDARALVAAAGAFARGRLVGVDLFDDYFSQAGDSRLVRYRTWLGQILRSSNFALCSTPTLARVIENYDRDLPVHVVNDPSPEVDVAKLPELLASKLAKTQNELEIRLAWFGVGDNPNFKVGLSDLAAYGGMLYQLANSDLNVELTVLTNPRALTADGLALIGKVPVRTKIEEWTETREREVLAEAFACFLPVNAQPFSAAKSLNRAVSALSSGSQVISAGYPLYQPLGELVYRDANSFLSDLARASMKLSPPKIGKYRAMIDSIASPEREAAALARFLGGLKPVVPKKVGPLALVHGQATNGAAHKAVRALQGLSVGSPYCAARLGFDVMFRPARDRLIMLVSDHAAKQLLPNVRSSIQPAQNVSERNLWTVPEDGKPGVGLAIEGPEWHSASLPFQISTYRATMARIGERMEAAFGPCRLFISESSQLPFSLEF